MLKRHAIALENAINYIKSSPDFVYVDSIYLYGSCARGQEKYNSDVDLMLCVKRDTPRSAYRGLRCCVSNGDYTLPEVNVEFANTDSFSFSKQFDENVRKDGVILWKR